MNVSATLNRYASKIRAVSIALIVMALFFMMRKLPVDQGVAALESYVSELGILGPIVFGLVYVVAALLFIPGSALTLTAGAVFGLGWGTVTVSIASTTAAALAFLIARYAARDKIASKARLNPKFRAVERAIEHGGGKIIAMLRLSPAMPFSLGNYLFGLTPIRFGTYVLVSWVFMLPGTFMFVYIGNAGRAGLQAAAGGSAGRGMGQTILMIVGLLATVAVTVYVTRLAKRALQDAAQMDQAQEEREMDQFSPETNPASSNRVPWGTLIIAGMALVMLTAVTTAYTRPDLVEGLFSAKKVVLAEAYTHDPDSPQFDHSAFDALLKKHVSMEGWVDYAALKGDASLLDAYITSIGEASFDQLGRDEKLALLINAYNAFTLRLILDYYPIESIKDIPADMRWEHVRWKLGSQTLSLNQLEQEHIRPKFKEPRIHFALVCAAVGCPKLRNEAYMANRIEEQLQDQADYCHRGKRWLRFEPGSDTIYLTRLYQWYGDDFRQVGGSPLEYAARYVPALRQAMENGKTPRIEWLEYSWKLNSSENAPRLEVG